VLSFTKDGLQADALRARLWNHELSLQVRTERGPVGVATYVRARGDMDMDSLRKHESLWILGFAQGRTAWTGELSLPHDPASPMELRIQSALDGVAVNLPAPLGKAQDDSVQFSLTRTFSPNRDRLTFAYGSLGNGSLLFRDGPEGRRIDRGELRLGGRPAEIPDTAGLRLTGEARHIDFGPWLKLLAAASADEDRKSLLASLNTVEVRAAELGVLGQTLHAVEIGATANGRGWTGHLTSEETAGDFHLDTIAPRAALALSLDRIRLNPEAPEAGRRSDVDPNTLPKIQLTSKHLYLRGEDLGEVNVNVRPHDQEVALDWLRLAGPAVQVEAKGRWLADPQHPRSELELNADTRNLGHLLEMLDYAPSLKGGKGKLTARVAWPGGPSRFSLATVKGNLELSIQDGRLLTVNPGVGRIFGLLSLQALPRRLTLDFRDVVDKGFAFDRIHGTFTLGKGQAYTRGLDMDSPAAHVEVTGRIGLVAQNYDQRARVTPHVSSGLPWAAALGGGVGVGVGAALFVVQTLFGNPLDKMVSYEYTLTGSWHHPVVQRVESTTPGS
jgi:uncharacterized protein (TIGR02099 family)